MTWYVAFFRTSTVCKDTHTHTHTHTQVHSIPLKAIDLGLLTVPKKNKVNAFSGKVLEIEGLEDLKVEQAFELSDASAERSAAGCTIKVRCAV